MGKIDKKSKALRDKRHLWIEIDSNLCFGSVNMHVLLQEIEQMHKQHSWARPHSHLHDF